MIDEDDNEENDRMKHGNIVGKMGKNENRTQKLTRIFFFFEGKAHSNHQRSCTGYVHNNGGISN